MLLNFGFGGMMIGGKGKSGCKVCRGGHRGRLGGRGFRVRVFAMSAAEFGFGGMMIGGKGKSGCKDCRGGDRGDWVEEDIGLEWLPWMLLNFGFGDDDWGGRKSGCKVCRGGDRGRLGPRGFRERAPRVSLDSKWSWQPQGQTPLHWSRFHCWRLPFQSTLD